MYNSISNMCSDVCCYGLDLEKVAGAYKDLDIKGLPVVMFFKNGEKIGEITGSVNPQSVKIVLHRHIPSEDEEEAETSTNTVAVREKDFGPGVCKVCTMERIAELLPKHPKDGEMQTRREVHLRKPVEDADNCKFCRFLIDSCKRDPDLYKQLKLEKGTFEQLTNEGRLSDDREYVLKTIRDAIMVVIKLGF